MGFRKGGGTGEQAPMLPWQRDSDSHCAPTPEAPVGVVTLVTAKDSEVPVHVSRVARG